MKSDLNNDNPDSGRRLLVGGMAGGVVADYAPNAAAETSATTGPSNPVLKQNLVTQYLRPPFKAQEQKWPGLASKMVPRPDHGEKTYKGSGRLAGRKALITGGDSGMGRAAAIAFAREGADVAFGFLPQEQEDVDEVEDLIGGWTQSCPAAWRHPR